MQIHLLLVILAVLFSLTACDEETAQLEQNTEHENFKRLFQEKESRTNVQQSRMGDDILYLI